MQEITTIQRRRACGHNLVAPELGTLTARTESGKATKRGEQLCESIWGCAPCEGRARAEDTHLLTTACLRHLANGGMLAVAVFTTRHGRQHRLDALVNALLGTRKSVDEATGEITKSVPGAYTRMLKDRGLRERIGSKVGYVGMARNPEFTRTKDNAWNPHLNGAFFLGGKLDGTPANGTMTGTFKPSEEALEQFANWVRHYWADTLKAIDPEFETSTECERANCKCGGKGHGVSIDFITSPDDKKLIEYLTKAGGETADSVKADIEAAKGAAAEVSYSAAKLAKSKRSMTPFQFLDRLWAIERDGIDPALAPGYGTAEQCRAWFLEYEEATHNRRAFVMTQGLKRHTNLIGETEKYRYEEMAARLLGGVVLTKDAHTHVMRAETDYEVSVLVGEEREADVPALVVLAEGRADHVRVVDGDGCAEYMTSLAEVMKAKAKARADDKALMERLLEQGQTLADCPKCDGSGVLEKYRAIRDGECFQCGGSGKVVGESADDDHDE
jgi:hypothetical protein